MKKKTNKTDKERLYYFMSNTIFAYTPDSVLQDNLNELKYFIYHTDNLEDTFELKELELVGDKLVVADDIEEKIKEGDYSE